MPFTSATPTRRRDGCVSGMAFSLYFHLLRVLCNMITCVPVLVATSYLTCIESALDSIIHLTTSCSPTPSAMQHGFPARLCCGS